LLGVFYFRHGRYAEAEPLFRKVIELVPDNFNGYLALGGLDVQRGRYDDAEAMLKQSVAIKPNPFAYSNLGTLYYQRGRYADAVGMFERAMELGSLSYVVAGNLADSYRQAPGMSARAPQAYARAIALAGQELALNPKNAAALSSLAVYHAKLGAKNQALDEITRARKLARADTTIGFKAVIVYELSGRRKEALSTLEEILRAGYALEQVETEPELKQLRQDPRYSIVKSIQANQSSGTKPK
jgi:serine/threonine-protein kinase